jgi:hypothetical protein
MIDALRMILEVGKKRRVVAGAMDWPGLDRWGTSEEDAIEKLLSLRPAVRRRRRTGRHGEGVRAGAGGRGR